MTDTAGVFARDIAEDMSQIPTIIQKVCEHRPWFDDRIWSNEAHRRWAAAGYLADAWQNGKLWVVWHGDEVTGILVANQVNYGIDASCHFVFFDRTLANKRRICLNAMAWLFENLELEVLRVEVPTYARALANWARKKLGYRYESEARSPSWPAKEPPLTTKQAMLGSRKHRATLYEGKWHDALLLSLTREEFAQQYVRAIDEAQRCFDGPVSGADRQGTISTIAGPPEPEPTPH